jgi:hypothetical protein
MQRLTLCLLLVVIGLGCDRASPLSPDAGLVTITGYVYFQNSSGGEPMIHNAVIAVEDDSGSRTQAASRPDGFYTISVKPGRISITASKEGFEAKVIQAEVSDDTVLNFSLTPMTE